MKKIICASFLVFMSVFAFTDALETDIIVNGKIYLIGQERSDAIVSSEDDLVITIFQSNFPIQEGKPNSDVKIFEINTIQVESGETVFLPELGDPFKIIKVESTNDLHSKITIKFTSRRSCRVVTRCEWVWRYGQREYFCWIGLKCDW